MGLWSQIKQRRITQVVIAYLAGGWMVLAVIDQVVDREVLPLVVYEVALTLYLSGIAAALIIGWYHGERGEQKAPLIELVMLGVVGIAGVAASVQVVRSALQEQTLADAVAASGTDLRRIAVLYFEDMSADASMAPIADGITEGLIETLGQIRELDVTSRDAAERVRDVTASADSIARILGAGTLIDGTVDQDGDDLRVSVRVLEGASGIPLFRDSYSWPTSEVASVGNELASEVSRALREQLGQEIRLREGRSAAPNAAAWLQVARAQKSLKDARDALASGEDEAASDAFDAAVSELGQAIESAPEWAEPLVLRGQVAYEKYALATTVEELLGTFDDAVGFANRALAVKPGDADALDLRGTVRYRRWLYGLEDDEATQDALFEAAQEDLEQSLSIERGRAGTNSTLSHLYLQVRDWPKALLAAREAYEQDAFLSVVDGVLWRLYAASYDLGDHDEASRWCAEGARRFPENYRFVQCQLFLMTMPQAEPDIEEAWSLYEELEPLLTEGREDLFLAQAETVVGGVIGRAGLQDSADVVLRRARVGPDVDPDGEILSFEAAMRSVIGDEEGSIEALERYMSLQPDHFPLQHWWWRNVEGNPDFERLRVSN